MDDAADIVLDDQRLPASGKTYDHCDVFMEIWMVRSSMDMTTGFRVAAAVTHALMLETEGTAYGLTF